MNQREVIDRLDAAMQELAKANRLAMALLREMAAKEAQPEEWVRLPANGDRCQISKWSRSTIWNYIQDKKIGTKRIKGCRFYSADDVRKLLREA